MIAGGRATRWRTGTWAVPAIVGGVALAVLAVAPTPSQAHAVLVSTTPAADAILDAAPERVELVFDEPVEVPTGGVRVYDTEGVRIDEGPASTADAARVAVALPDPLPEGGYVVVWRVVSADSHPISGVWTFTYGDAAAIDAALVDELFGGAGTDFAGVAGPVLRALAYAGTATTFGALLLLLPSSRRRTADRADDADEDPAADVVKGIRPVVLAAAAAGLAASVLAVPVQAMAVTGRGLLDAFALPALREVMLSSFGQSTSVRVIWLAVLLLLIWRRAPRVVSLAASAVAVLSFVLDGHQRTAELAWLLVSADVVHLLAIATWFGGVVVLARLTAAPIDGDRAARVVRRFSDAALYAAAAVVVSGMAMGWALVRVPRAAVTTGYGWTLLAKIGLVVVVLAIAAYNRRVVVPRLPATGWQTIRYTIRWEAALLSAVLVVTGALVTQQPAADRAGITGIAVVKTTLGTEQIVEIVVEPARSGLNTVHVYVLDPPGMPSDAVDDLALELTFAERDIGPLRVEPFFAGTGHWIANVDDFAFPGTWTITVIAGVDRFTEERAEVEVTINP